MKKYIAFGILSFLVVRAAAQQLPLTSQYMFNSLVINPAIAGTKDDRVVFRLQNRNQWVGLEGAPVTQTASVHGMVESLNIGLGAVIVNDVVGPTKQTGILTDYSYHLPVTSTTNLSMGLGIGIIQYKVDGQKLTTDVPNDNAILRGSDSHVLPDATFGLLYYGPKFYAGISVPHLIGGKIRDTEFTLSRQYQAIAGYVFELNDEIQMEPSVFFRLVSPVPASLDINSKFIFKESFWLGISYRTSDAVVLMAGLRIAEKFHFGYSYDITTSILNEYSRGSHEVMVGFDLYKKNRKNSRRLLNSSPMFL